MTPVSNMQKLVEHWKTLQPKKNTKKRGREDESPESRTKSKTQASTHVTEAYRCTNDIQQAHESNQ